MSAIVIDDLMKRVGKQRVFSNLNLEILDGEFFTLLGLKESGKTTLTRILMGYLKTNKGSALIYDMDCNKDSKEIKESVTFVPQDVLLQDNIRANTIFKKTLSAHNLKSTEDIEVLCDYFNFDRHLKIGDMDENERKIFSIINALIVKPRLVILDEPIKGLNHESRIKLFDHLKNLNQQENVTIFMLTDSLIEAKKHSKRIAYLHNGVIKDIEYVNAKPANDKILRINNYRGNLNHFTSIGAHLIKDEPDETILYYDQNLTELSKVIYEEGLESYSLENADLKDKIEAYYADDNTYITKEQIQKERPLVSSPEKNSLEAIEINGVLVEETESELKKMSSDKISEDTKDHTIISSSTMDESQVTKSEPSKPYTDQAIINTKDSDSVTEAHSLSKENVQDQTVVIDTKNSNNEEDAQ
ncbi:MAG: ATP-binding cassette domain-containing protein [Tissierellia bacterium]|nr:ATP-binding cassette domain-containing protein [Tissierellia bacterium]